MSISRYDPFRDLRTLQHCPGDIRPAEQNRYLFLETLLAARDKIYLLYTNLDVQRDQELHPCVPLAQLPMNAWSIFWPLTSLSFAELLTTASGSATSGSRVPRSMVRRAM